MVSVSGNVEYKPYTNQAAVTVGPDPKTESTENIRARQTPAPGTQDARGKPSGLREEARKPDVEFRDKSSAGATSVANNNGSNSERGSVLDVVV